MDFLLDLIQIAGWQQQSFQRIPVPFDVGFSEQLHRLIDSKNAVVVVLVLNGFSGAPDTEYQSKA